MKINSTSSKLALNELINDARGKKSISGQPRQDRSASVRLSPAARSLAALSDDSADIRTAKVQELRDALASGELVIKPERIADGLLASVRELLK